MAPRGLHWGEWAERPLATTGSYRVGTLPGESSATPNAGPPDRAPAVPTIDFADPGIQAIVDSLPALVGYWDTDLTNRLANRAYVDYFGTTPEQMRGVHISEVLVPEMLAANRPYIDAVLAGEPQVFDREVVLPSGEVRYTQVSYLPDIGEGGVRGFFVLVTNITARRHAEVALQASEDRYRTLLEQLPSVVVTMVDPDLRLQWLDGRVVHDEGVDRESMLGRPVRETSGDAAHGAVIEGLYARALAGEVVSTEVQSRIVDREYRLEIAPIYGPDGTVTGALGVAQDITERREREKQGQALATVATLVAGTADPAAVFGVVAEQIAHLFDASVAAVTRFDVTANRGVVVGGWSASHDDPTGASYLLDGAVASAEVFRTGLPARSDMPIVTDADPAHETIEQFSITAAIAAPITVGGSLWGTIGVAFSARPCPPRAEQRLQQFAHLVSLAISNAEAWTALSQQASTDPVTGIANYRTFHTQLHSEVERARRYDRALSLVVLDLDHFKSVNDAHGHQVGDEVLTEVARRLSANARDGELVARIGGEEFAWLMPETTGDDAYRAAERVRRAVEREPYASVGTLTVSAGVCAIEPGCDADELFGRADSALYVAKDSGRNVAVVYNADVPRIDPRSSRPS
jgi:diguanylate cyclase (GGDEF)-like protein/PAS domain S-box-containing protein